jgi:hypothetical protein
MKKQFLILLMLGMVAGQIQGADTGDADPNGEYGDFLKIINDKRLKKGGVFQLPEPQEKIRVRINKDIKTIEAAGSLKDDELDWLTFKLPDFKSVVERFLSNDKAGFDPGALEKATADVIKQMEAMKKAREKGGEEEVRKLAAERKQKAEEARKAKEAEEARVAAEKAEKKKRADEQLELRKQEKAEKERLAKEAAEKAERERQEEEARQEALRQEAIRKAEELRRAKEAEEAAERARIQKEEEEAIAAALLEEIVTEETRKAVAEEVRLEQIRVAEELRRAEELRLEQERIERERIAELARLQKIEEERLAALEAARVAEEMRLIKEMQEKMTKQQEEEANARRLLAVEEAKKNRFKGLYMTCANCSHAKDRNQCPNFEADPFCRICMRFDEVTPGKNYAEKYPLDFEDTFYIWKSGFVDVSAGATDAEFSSLFRLLYDCGRGFYEDPELRNWEEVKKRKQAYYQAAGITPMPEIVSWAEKLPLLMQALANVPADKGGPFDLGSLQSSNELQQPSPSHPRVLYANYGDYHGRGGQDNRDYAHRLNVFSSRLSEYFRKYGTLYEKGIFANSDSNMFHYYLSVLIPSNFGLFLAGKDAFKLGNDLLAAQAQGKQQEQLQQVSQGTVPDSYKDFIHRVYEDIVTPLDDMYGELQKQWANQKLVEDIKQIPGIVALNVDKLREILQQKYDDLRRRGQSALAIPVGQNGPQDVYDRIRKIATEAGIQAPGLPAPTVAVVSSTGDDDAAALAKEAQEAAEEEARQLFFEEQEALKREAREAAEEEARQLFFEEQEALKREAEAAAQEAAANGEDIHFPEGEESVLMSMASYIWGLDAGSDNSDFYRVVKEKLKDLLDSNSSILSYTPSQIQSGIKKYRQGSSEEERKKEAERICVELKNMSAEIKNGM